MDILIENYRGVDIYFYPSIEKFTFDYDNNKNEKQSLSACKKGIDEYLKINIDFKPFWIRNIGNGQKFEVVSLRRDGRFVVIEGGRKNQISDYQEGRYIEYKEEDDKYYEEIKNFEKQIRDIENQIGNVRSGIKSKTLAEIRTEQYPQLT